MDRVSVTESGPGHPANKTYLSHRNTSLNLLSVEGGV